MAIFTKLIALSVNLSVFSLSLLSHIDCPQSPPAPTAKIAHCRSRPTESGTLQLENPHQLGFLRPFFSLPKPNFLRNWKQLHVHSWTRRRVVGPAWGVSASVSDRKNKFILKTGFLTSCAAGYSIHTDTVWILACRKVYTAVTFKNYYISHVAKFKNKIMTDGKHKFMHLKWTAPDGQNVTGN